MGTGVVACICSDWKLFGQKYLRDPLMLRNEQSFFLHFLDLFVFLWFCYKLCSCVCDLLVWHTFSDNLRDLKGGILFLVDHKDNVSTVE